MVSSTSYQTRVQSTVSNLDSLRLTTGSQMNAHATSSIPDAAVTNVDEAVTAALTRRGARLLTEAVQLRT